MKTHRHLRSRIVVAVAACCCLLTSHSSADTSIEEVLKKRMAEFKETSLGTLLKAKCPQFSAYSKTEGCAPADSSGDGLKCPTATPVTPGSVSIETCDEDFFDVLEGTLGADGLGRLKASGTDRASLKVQVRNENSVSQHNHTQTANATGQCVAEYIRRKDFVRAHINVYSTNEVNVAPPAADASVAAFTSFNANVKENQGVSRSFTALMCSYTKHGEPRSCAPTEKPDGGVCEGPDGGPGCEDPGGSKDAGPPSEPGQ